MGLNWMLEEASHHVMCNAARKSLQGSVQISVLQTDIHPVCEEILTFGFPYSKKVLSALLASPWLCRCGSFVSDI